jgi:hypothetical protein
MADVAMQLQIGSWQDCRDLAEGRKRSRVLAAPTSLHKSMHLTGALDKLGLNARDYS